MFLSVNKVPKKLGTDTLNKVLNFAEKYLRLNPRMNIHIEFVRNKGILCHQPLLILFVPHYSSQIHQLILFFSSYLNESGN